MLFHNWDSTQKTFFYIINLFKIYPGYITENIAITKRRNKLTKILDYFKENY